MATQFDPIAKDESLNTTESPSRNIADVLAEELSAIEQAIAGGSGSGGHTIVNASGTDMTQRAKMQFVDAGVTDDSTEQATKVEVVQLIDDEDELTNAPDGVYQGDYEDDPEDILDASMVAYGEGSVKDALGELSDGVVEYYDYAVSMYISSSVSPFTYYNSVDISAFASGKRILSAQPIVTSSAQRVIAIINNTQTTAYVYGTDSSSIVLRVTAKEA